MHRILVSLYQTHISTHDFFFYYSTFHVLYRNHIRIDTWHPGFTLKISVPYKRNSRGGIDQISPAIINCTLYTYRLKVTTKTYRKYIIDPVPIWRESIRNIYFIMNFRYKTISTRNNIYIL